MTFFFQNWLHDDYGKSSEKKKVYVKVKVEYLKRPPVIPISNPSTSSPNTAALQFSTNGHRLDRFLNPGDPQREFSIRDSTSQFQATTDILQFIY